MTDTSTPQAPHAPPRRLTRSATDRMVSGVCGGLAEYTGLDPVIFRVVFVVATILGGAGLAAYLVAWIAIPAQDAQESHAQSWIQHRHGAGRVVLIALAILAVLILGNAFNGPRHPWGGGFVLLALLGVGIWYWTRQQDAPAMHVPPVSPVPPAVPTLDDQTMVLPPVPPAPPVPPVRAPRERSRLFGLTFSAMLLAAGVLAAIQASDAADLSAAVVFAVLLIVVGGGLVVGAWVGRSRGLIVLGVLLTMATAAATVADVPISGGAGERAWRPQSASALEREYRLGAGSIELDLRGLELDGRARTVDVSLGAGRVRLWVPSGTEVELDTHVGMGSSLILGREEEGLDVDRDLAIGRGASRLVLRVDVGVGRLEVRR